MKRTVEREAAFCDVCGKGAGLYQCLECGRDFCYKCSRIETKDYPPGVHFTGTGAGRYCKKCDTSLRASGDPLHRAYRLIESLRAEEDGWYGEFKKRYEAAEKNVRALYDAARWRKEGGR